MAEGGRSVATRHEKLAINSADMVQLALLRQDLRTLRPEERT